MSLQTLRTCRASAESELRAVTVHLVASKIQIDVLTYILSFHVRGYHGSLGYCLRKRWAMIALARKQTLNDMHEPRGLAPNAKIMC